MPGTRICIISDDTYFGKRQKVNCRVVNYTYANAMLCLLYLQAYFLDKVRWFSLSRLKVIARHMELLK